MPGLPRINEGPSFRLLLDGRAETEDPIGRAVKHWVHVAERVDVIVGGPPSALYVKFISIYRCSRLPAALMIPRCRLDFRSELSRRDSDEKKGGTQFYVQVPVSRVPLAPA